MVTRIQFFFLGLAHAAYVALGAQALRAVANKHSHINNATALSARPQGRHRQVLHNFGDMQYFADFNIGGQQIAGIFDTGSFELLVQSTRCEHCARPVAHYDRLKSKTYTKDGRTQQHVFGSGPCMTMAGYDTVSIGPMSSPHQAFWEITDHNIPVFDTAKFAAIVGIGPSFGYENSEKTLLMSYGIEEFSICLQKPYGSDGYLTWGPVATEETKANDFVSAPVMGKHHWATQMTNVHFGPEGGLLTGPRGPCQGTGCAAIVDSGTSLIAAPGIALQELSSQIGHIMEDCSNLHTLPTLHFTLGGQDFTLPPRAYVMKVTGAMMEANNIWDVLFFKPKVKKLNQCMPAFMQMDMMSQHGPIWILGMPFFRYYHTSFDLRNQKMHFATAGPGCEPLPFKANRTALLAMPGAEEDFKPMDVEVDQLVPPTLSSQLDFPFGTDGEVVL